jgi:AAHS family 4-hydroxybenzoate transporter-like MFS transporter
MTLWKQGASAVPVLARLRIIFGSAGIGIGGVLPIGTALVTEFAPRRIRATMIVMGVVGVALGGGLAGLVAAQFMSIYGSRARDRPARAAGAPSRPNRLAPRCACCILRVL